MKVSVVVAGRNDDYGGGFVHRLNTSVASLAALAARHAIEAEYLLVEYRPPADRPRLKDEVRWPDGIGVRVVTVSDEIHRRTPNSDCMEFLAHVAVNAGIRRAPGNEILVISADIILSDEMAAFIARDGFSEMSFYRAARSDLQGQVALNGSVDELLTHCREQVRITYNKFDAAGDFIMMSRSKWHELHGFQELRSWGTIDTYMVALANSRGLEEVDLAYPIYHQDHHRRDAEGRPQMGWREDVVGKANDDTWGLGGLELETEVIR